MPSYKNLIIACLIISLIGVSSCGKDTPQAPSAGEEHQDSLKPETPPKNGSKQGKNGDPKEREIGIAREFKPRPTLQSDSPAFTLSSFCGNPTKDGCQKVEVKFNGKLTRIEYLYHDSQWCLKARQVVDPVSDAYFQTDYKYDNNSRLTEKISLHSGMETFHHIYQYNQSGDITEFQWHEWKVKNVGLYSKDKHREKKLFYKKVYSYNDNSQLILEEQYFGEQKAVTKEFEYDNEHNLLSYAKTFTRTKQDPETGNPVKTTEIGEIGKHSYKDGRLESLKILRPVYSEDGEYLRDHLLGEILYSYTNGRLSKEEHKMARPADCCTYTYSFDDKNRLFEKARISDQGKEITTFMYN
ncbi:hypothetical protein ACFL54_00335 [Planctomycetota bacterium]